MENSVLADPVISRPDINQNRLLESARSQATEIGVTRMASITGLDRIGLPVWQAIRPLGRALSVHQGKGQTDILAQLSALGEAAESHAAESLCPDMVNVSHADLKKQDFVEYITYSATRNGGQPDFQKIRNWTRMQDVRTGTSVFVPHACVSLDYTLSADPALDRSSNGLGAGQSWDQAISKALFECLERDALGGWLRSAPSFRLAREIESGALPSRWSDPWTDMLAELEIRIRVFAVPSVIDIPVFICTLQPTRRTAPFSLPTYGSACAADSASALFAAFAEAMQSRLTLIAGARDDVMPSDYTTGRAIEFCPPIPPGWIGKSWPDATRSGECWNSQVDELARAGFERVLIRRLTNENSLWKVVKVIVPGLGSPNRKREAQK
ncbi:MAG: YcaO-like family protein [Pseudomonadota bacterium]